MTTRARTRLDVDVSIHVRIQRCIHGHIKIQACVYNVVRASPENIENTHTHVYSDIRVYAQLFKFEHTRIKMRKG